ncbi:MAG: hypothetical protein ABI542_06180 [Gemmatimonadota bacterium]
MSRVFMLAALIATPFALQAQAVVIPSPEAQIAAAVLPLPEEFRAEATVLGYRVPGTLVTLREGSGAMVCLADNPTEARFHVACYHRDLEPFMARGRALRASGVTDADSVDAVRFAEVKAGTIRMPDRGALWQMTGPAGSFDWVSNTADSTVRSLYVIYIPGATAASTGISTAPAVNLPWLMFPGTPKAHIMFVPRM